MLSVTPSVPHPKTASFRLASLTAGIAILAVLAANPAFATPSAGPAGDGTASATRSAPQLVRADGLADDGSTAPAAVDPAMDAAVDSHLVDAPAGSTAAIADGSGSGAASAPAGTVADPLDFGDDDLGAVLETFYRARWMAPVWTDTKGLTPKGHRILDAMRGAGAEGLDAAAYDLERVDRLLARGGREALAAADQALSRAWVAYARDLVVGQSRRDASFKSLKADEDLAPVDLLAWAAMARSDAEGGADLLARTRPHDQQYRRLITRLDGYRALQATGGWAADIPEGETLRPGDKDPRVPAIRARLLAEGDLSPAVADFMGVKVPGAPDRLTYTGGMAEAVARFQTRHGLDVDGVLGRNTLAALNVPVDVRITQILASLERWRRLPLDLGENHILVNVPQFELFVHEGATVVDRMRVAVGRTIHATPLFSDQIEYMEFNPYWNVPISIAQSEVIPKQMEDPAYLAARGFTVIPRGTSDAVGSDDVDWSDSRGAARTYRLRQNPGPRNPLGTVKFMFPNQHSVYLHDTNSRSVFSRSDRAVSHGCVRVQDPERLANYLLENYTSRTDKTYRDFRGNHPRRVSLSTPLKVHLAYLTAFVEDDGTVRFSDDIYKQDTGLLEAMEKKRFSASPDATVASRD